MPTSIVFFPRTIPFWNSLPASIAETPDFVSYKQELPLLYSNCSSWTEALHSLPKKQGSHRLEKYLNLEGFLEKSLKTKSALKSTGKSLKSLEKSLNFSIFCRT